MLYIIVDVVGQYSLKVKVEKKRWGERSLKRKRVSGCGLCRSGDRKYISICVYTNVLH